LSKIEKPVCIGIDFGTTNTCVAVLEKNGKARVLNIDPTSSDPRLIKTLLYFPNRKEAFFGKQAIEQYFERGMEGRFFQSIKRLLPNSEFTGTSLFGSHMGVEEFIARFLQELKNRIEKEVGPTEGIPIHIGRPARYSQDSAKEGLAVVRFKHALANVGWEHARLIEEPVAASATNPSQNHAMTLVADLGGGTSDFTIFKIESELKSQTFAVHGIPTAGDALDSDFFEAKLFEPFGAKIQYQRPFSSNILTLPPNLIRLLPKWHHHGFLRDKATWNFILDLRKELVDPTQKPQLENLITLVEENLGYKLHLEVERIKIELSEKEKEAFLFKSYPIHIGFDVSKKDFNSIIEHNVNEIVKTAVETCRIGKLGVEEIEVLQMTGGTSKVPLVRAALKQAFPKAKLIDHETFTAVAEGLALLGKTMEVRYS
jgi:hypothetical chaperone protein